MQQYVREPIGVIIHRESDFELRYHERVVIGYVATRNQGNSRSRFWKTTVIGTPEQAITVYPGLCDAILQGTGEHPTTPSLIESANLVKPEVQLVGTDGNAFSIIGRVAKAWRRMGREDIAKEFTARATSGDYSNVLAMAVEYVDEEAVWGPDEDEEDDEDNFYDNE